MKILYKLHQRHIQKEVSRNNKIKHKKQKNTFNGQKVLKITIEKNINNDNKNHIIQANLFCGAQTYSTFWFETKILQSINDGENFGFIKTLIKKSIKKIIINVFIAKKSLKIQKLIKIGIAKNNKIPAQALTSLSFKTGISYQSTFSQNWKNLFIKYNLKNKSLNS